MAIAWLAALVLAANPAAEPGPSDPQADQVSVVVIAAPDGTQTLIHEVAIAASAASVWEAVSTAHGWTTWAAPVAWQDGDMLETSYSPTASPGDPSTIRQQILVREPGQRLVFRTVKAPEGFPHFEAYRQVTVAIELEPVGESRTRVRLSSVGFPGSEAGRELAGFFREGNRVTLEQLRERFLSGPVDWSRPR